MSEIKLKPCPFCGGGAAIGRHGDNYFIECCKCGSRTWFYKSADKATEAWNRREVNGMSDDLISRKALMKQFTVSDNGRRIPEYDIDNFPITISVKDVKDIIRKAPTAFDNEKVVEKLKSAIGDIHYTEDGSFNGKCIEDFEFIQAKTALELVEKGGIE